MIRLWLLLMLLSLASLADVMEYATRQSQDLPAIAGLTCGAIFKATVLTFIYALCRKIKILRIFAIILIVAFSLMSILNGGCWLFYGFGISRKLITIISETNQSEMSEFLPELADKFLALLHSISFWTGAVLFSLCWILFPRIARKWFIPVVSSLSAVGLIYLVYVFSTAEFGRTNHIMLARSAYCVVSFLHDRSENKKLLNKKRPLPYPQTLDSDSAAQRIIVIIGESASRDHLSLYGYPLPTSPYLDSISDTLYRFDDAVASSTSTAQNIPRLLTFMTDEPNAKEWYEYPSLLQIFHKLGYRTYWISNQEFSGKLSNLSSILSADADVVKYTGSISSEDHYLSKYDDVILPEFKNAFAASDSLQLTFLHLMGSHFQYNNRYPESRSHFSPEDIMDISKRKWLNDKKAEIVANYDNSILFTDSIIGVIFDDVKKTDIPTVAVYLSDHGDNVYDDGDYRGRDPNFVKVPFIVYANEAYRQKNPNIIADMEKSLANPFSTSELPQLLLHLSGSSYRLYDPLRDPISQKFSPRQRFVDDEPYSADQPD
ncbi:MAG: phosphoethanolamine transferase [Muribaculaceae bacterium]|nr:phosphoethanolamine transferase [Muribaculaceae bacterium]